MASTEAERFWEGRYQGEERVWSGRVNPVLVEVAGALPVGRALDLGCGEGGDSVWLAGLGWSVTAVDISRTALERAAGRAAEAGVSGRIDFQRHDLSQSFPAGGFDLVSAQYLQSPVAFPTEQVLRRAAGSVRLGGMLLVVTHGSVPSWARDSHPEMEFPTAGEALAALELDPREWRTDRLGSPAREAVGPNGEAGTLLDTVIALTRVA